MLIRLKNKRGNLVCTSLEKHFKEISKKSILTLFTKQEKRVEDLSIEWRDFVLDYSKNILNKETKRLLCELAEESNLKEAIQGYFDGDKINKTESRSVLHTALRSNLKNELSIENIEIKDQVKALRIKIEQFSEEIISGEYKGYTGKPIERIVNIGIGGSDLGPSMVIEALRFYKNHLNVSFISNIDGDHLHEQLLDLNAETTLFIIVSKTFTTQETITNANSVLEWFLGFGKKEDLAKHFVAVTSEKEKAQEFGILDENIFPMWDWVGGRYSLWGSVGLSISLSLGFNCFEELLDGAEKMDSHFRTASFNDNMPVMMALISIWYNNFFGSETEAIIPYSEYLGKLVPYLQQLSMESNGKCVDQDGNTLNHQSGYIIWGGTGTNSQHAFFQLLHQGTKLVPTTFIGFKKPLHGNKKHHNSLMSNFFGQSRALLVGKNKESVIKEMKDFGLSADKVQFLAPHKVFKGNKPTNTLLIEKLTPSTLGSLIALYEHKTFVEGHVWNIFSFDQWGVELGKQMSNDVFEDLENTFTQKYDQSTNYLINKFRS